MTWDTYIAHDAKFSNPSRYSAPAPCLHRSGAIGRTRKLPASFAVAARGATGQPVAAKIRVIDMASGRAYMPEHAIKTMPQKSAPGVKHYFYARGKYEIAVPPGRYQIEVVRGIRHEEAIDNAEVGAGLAKVRDFDIPVLRDLHASHTHYHLEIDEDPDDRLRMVPPAEALDVSVISYLVRNDSPFSTNHCPVGRLRSSPATAR